MYRRHKIISMLLFVLVFVLCFLFKINYEKLAETAISVVSIALAVYISASSVLLGSDFAKKLKTAKDEKITTKTQLGVLSTYLRFAGGFSIATIIFSVWYIADVDMSFILGLLSKIECSNLIHFMSLALSSFSCGMFAINLLFIWLVLIFLINAMSKSV